MEKVKLMPDVIHSICVVFLSSFLEMFSGTQFNEIRLFVSDLSPTLNVGCLLLLLEFFLFVLSVPTVTEKS